MYPAHSNMRGYSTSTDPPGTPAYQPHQRHPNEYQRGYSTSNYPPAVYQPQQQRHSGYQQPHGYQTLRPLPLNSSYPYSGHDIDRTASYGSRDSSYGTRVPSVASPVPQQSYSASRPLDQQCTSYHDGGRRSPDIEAVRTATLSNSTHKNERGASTPPSSPSEYPCLYPNCGHISSRAHDLKRHYTVHFPPAVEELLDCKYAWCGRTGAHGFKKEDHRKEHYRKVHMKGSGHSERSG